MKQSTSLLLLAAVLVVQQRKKRYIVPTSSTTRMLSLSSSSSWFPFLIIFLCYCLSCGKIHAFIIPPSSYHCDSILVNNNRPTPTGSITSNRPSYFISSPAPISSSTCTSTTLFAKSGTKKKKPTSNIICVNRQARRNFEIVETLEAGIVLKGTEVKSIRDGKMNLRDAYVKASKNGRSCILLNCHIGKHTQCGPYFQHEEKRPKPLLVHKSEARKLLQKSETTGMTIVPLKAYFSDSNKVKIEIALCRGKNVRDKRADIKERDMKRETGRIIKNFRM